ncbi:uncharacterized protein PV09_08728 [Verruconis gallopava]|uniref:THO complex subunit 2 n=1 Tax=Verruconis gallopava TaxID=253628 RepID=A0A0D2A038_9PEZI|nr:uncharacterized protein PV09_08728 [Verruconis gallopava]KIV99674.1 hypothetical protein PV09_08728 [Verruconis gallopava]
MVPPPTAMPPQQQFKRKRGDHRAYSSDTGERGRPSPHRPENMALAHGNGVNGRGHGTGIRRASRGGRGGAMHSPSGPAPASYQVLPNPSQAAKPITSNLSSNTASPPTPVPVPVKTGQPTPASTQKAAPPMQYPEVGLPPQKDPSTYLYSYFTPDRCDSWKETGRQTVIDDALARADAEDLQELGVYFQEVLHLITEGLINPQDAGALIKDVLEGSPKAEELDLPSLFLDTVAVILSPQYPTGKEDTGRESGLNQFLQATGVDKRLVCMLLDEKLLIGLRIVRPTFDRMGIRHSTNVLYRQSGFNLLREESEGYSKLMTEFFTVTHNFKPDKETVEQTWEKVKALIGAFDLDVGRVLDITLDAFANNLIKHNKFFIRLLRYSDFWPQNKALVAFAGEDQGLSTLPPWSSTSYPSLETLPEDAERIAELRHGRDIMFWDRVREVGIQAFFELGGRRPITNADKAAFLEELRAQEVEWCVDEKTKERRKKEEDADLWATRTNTLPAQGNSIAAQILGFKLRFYASDARDPQDRLSINLIWLAALLIKIGFISLVDLYPHIYPTDDKMDELRTKLEKEKAERLEKLKPGAGMNALMTAGALSEGEPPSSLPVNRALPDPMNKAGSRTPLRATETANATPGGSTPNATATAAQPEPKPELPEPEDQKIVLLRSLLLIGAIPDALYILGRFPWLLDVHDDLPKYIHRLLHYMLKKVYAETQPLQGRASDTTPGHIRIDVNNTPILEKRQAPRSIAWGQLEKVEWAEGDYGTSYRFYWDDWNDLVPICQNVDDVFTLCDSFLNLVGHKIGRDAELLTKIVRIGIKSLADDDSPANMSRWQKLAKRLLVPALSLTKDDPGTVNEVWELIKVFPIQVRYNMYSEWFGGQTSRIPDIKAAFDLSILRTRDVLKRISKTNVKEMARSLAKVAYSSPGVALKTGLQQIESYNNLIDTLIECIRYFTNIGFDVLIWQLLNSLGGSSRNRMQADGMIVSKWLQRLAEFTGKVCKRYYKDLDFKPMLLYVKDRLEKGDSTGLGVLGQLILSMGGIRSDQNWSEEQVVALSGGKALRAQTLQRVADKRYEREMEKTAKCLVHSLANTNLTGEFLILIARERQQYLERPSASGAPIKVLSTNLTNLQGAFVQYLEFLRSNYEVDEFDRVVPGLEELIGKWGIEPAIAFTIARPGLQARIEGWNKGEVMDVEMSDTKEESGEAEAAANGEDARMADDGEESQSGTPTTLSTAIASPGTIHPVLEQVIESLKGVLEPGFDERMSMRFYVRFWQSSLSDIQVAQYDDEVKNVRNALRDLSNDRTDISPKALKEKAAKRAALNQLDKELQDEWRASIQHKQKMQKTYSQERTSWFPLERFPPSKHTELTLEIVQECILPRIVLSEMDALFTAKFLFVVHKLNTPGFRIAKIMARVFNTEQFVAMLFMLTEREAKNMGIFLKEVLHQLKVWRDNKNLYEKEGMGPNNDNPGFAREIREDGTINNEDPKTQVMNHDDYRRILFKWHMQLDKAIMHCLKSREFMHVRNAILLLKQVHEYFPSLTFHGKHIYEQIEKLSREEERDDLKLSATSLLGDLKKMRTKWLLPQQFRPGDGPAALNAGAASTTGTPKTPDDKSKPLNAEATEFRPRASLSTSSNKAAEDGEIEDEKGDEGIVAPTGETMDVDNKPGIEDGTETSSTKPAEETTRASTPMANVNARPSPGPGRADLRPSTPAGRQDGNRSSAPQGSFSAPPGGLPARPAGPIPSHRDLHRRPEAERTPSRLPDAKPPHEQEGRLDRPTDMSREPPRRRSRSPGGFRSRGRTPEGVRLQRPDFDRRESGYGAAPVHVGPPPRDLMDPRDPRGSRQPREERHRRDRDGRRNEPDLRGPPPQPHDSRDRMSRSTEQPSRDPSGPTINLERAAYLGMADERKPEEDRRHESWMRSGQSMPRSGPAGSRGTSPRRRDDRAVPERLSRMGTRDRRDEAMTSSSNPMSDIPRHRDELFPDNARAQAESTYGSSNQPELRSRQDPNYGRLNAPASSEAMSSGPRNRGGLSQGRGGRTGLEPSSTTPLGPRNMPQSSPGGMQTTSPGQERPPPSGPAVNNRRGGPNQGNSLPSPSYGVSSDNNTATGVHPSRLQNIGGLPPVQTNIASSPGNTTIPLGPRSSGHRSTPSQTNMTAPSPTSRYPPTGPASTGGSLRGRSQLNLINNMLNDQQSSRNGGNGIRGRPGMVSQQSSAPQSPTTGAPLQQQQMPPPGSGPRSDPLAERLERPGTSGSDEQRSSVDGRRAGLRDDGGDRRRHGRSRSRSPRREAADNAMRQSGELPPRNGPNRDDPARRRDSGDRDMIHRRTRGGEGGNWHNRDRERDEGARPPRDGREGRIPGRSEGRTSMGMPPHYHQHQSASFGGGLPPQAPPSMMSSSPNGDMRRGGVGGMRRDDVDRRDDSPRMSGGRDGIKRRRPDEGPPGGPGMHDQKRPRRGQ